ncbi:MAG: HD domain-containing protein [Planctomycetota bacterium]|nr:MAG: HD domain-containing protein [Planctomycetota bacterium]
MAAKKRYSVLRDPVHGDVYLTHEEIALLDTAEVQRLRGIQQLGAASYVYPGAVHTRFDHSIGTLHCTQKLIDAINLNFELDARGCLSVGDEEARVIRAAALLHDVTHIPYGHNIEDQTGLIERHDTPARYEDMLSPKRELGRVLDKSGLRRDVLQILTAAPNGASSSSGASANPGASATPGARASIPPYWSQILSDTICSDLIDYLLRDAYFTGLKLQVDPRVLSYFRIERAGGNLCIDLAKRELLREDILSEVVRLLEARYYFSERVYYHHAKVAAGALLARAVELCLQGGALQPSELYDQTDASLRALLGERVQRLAPAQRKRAAHLAECFAHRRLYKRACVFPRYENEAVQDELVAKYFARGRHAERAAVEARIADLVRFATGREIDVLVYCPAARMQLKEAHTHVRWPGESTVRPLSEKTERVPRLADLERSYRNLWKFYVFADTRDPALLRRVQEIALAEFPGAVNVYRIDSES